MALPGNLTTITVSESDLLARVPSLTRLRDQRAADWAAQIAAGTADAQVDFRHLKGQDPAICKAVDDNAWKRILVFYTLAVIYQPMLGVEYAGEYDKWTEQAASALANFLFQADSDGDDLITGDEETAPPGHGFQVIR